MFPTLPNPLRLADRHVKYVGSVTARPCGRVVKAQSTCSCGRSPGDVPRSEVQHRPTLHGTLAQLPRHLLGEQGAWSSRCGNRCEPQ